MPAEVIAAARGCIAAAKLGQCVTLFQILTAPDSLRPLRIVNCQGSAGADERYILDEMTLRPPQAWLNHTSNRCTCGCPTS